MSRTDTIALCVEWWPRARTDSERRAILRRLALVAHTAGDWLAWQSWRRAVIAWSSNRLTHA